MKKLFDPHRELAKIRNQVQPPATSLHLLQSDVCGEKDQPLQDVTNPRVLLQVDHAVATPAKNETSVANAANKAAPDLG